MRLNTLRELWQAEYPTGDIGRNYEYGKDWYNVSFATGKRLYAYSAPSVYALAERLDMIPDRDIVAEAQRIVDGLLNGHDSVIAALAAGDTANALWTGGGVIMCEHAGTDKFDRALGRFYIVKDSGWSSTKR